MQISIASIKRAESGKNVLYRIVANLANYFDVPINDFLEIPHLSDELIEFKDSGFIASQPNLLVYLKTKKQSDLKALITFTSKLNYECKVQGDALLIKLYSDVHGLEAIERGRRLCIALQDNWGEGIKICLYWQKSNIKNTGEKSLVLAEDFFADSLSNILDHVNWGEVVVNRLILQSGYFQLEGHKIVSAKIPGAWQITQPHKSSTNTPIARHGEINQLTYLLNYSDLHKEGLTVYVTGCAGIGKTHLINYFYKKTLKKNKSIYLESSTGGKGNNDSSCKRLCLSLMSLDEFSDEGIATQKISQLNLPTNMQSWLLGYLFLGSASSVVGYTGWHKNIGVVLYALLENYAKHQHKAIYIDDVHIINNSCENFLPILVTCVKAFPILLVLAGRNIGSLSHLPGWLDQAYEIQLRGLSLEQLGNIATQVTQARGWNKVSHKVLNRSGGNPRILRQLMLCLKPAIDIPNFISAELLSLLSHLEMAESTAIKIASLLGENFSIQEFDQCFTRLLRGNSACTLHTLVSHGLLKLCGDKYSFQHSIERQIVLDALMPGEKNRLLKVCGLSINNSLAGESA